MDSISLILYIINFALLSGLLCIYTQNLRHIKSKLTIGLVVFVLLFMAETLTGVYFNLTTGTCGGPTNIDTAWMVLTAVKTIGFATLLWVSWE